MRWMVTTQANPSGEGVIADTVAVVDGNLVFTDKHTDAPVIAYATGQWLVVWREEA